MVIEIVSKKELEKIIDKDAKDIIEYFIKKEVILQPELRKYQDERPLQISKEYAEQWFVQALGAKSVGAGNYPIDIIKENKYGADIKLIKCKYKKNGEISWAQSSEASLCYNFNDDGKSLDNLFDKKEKGEIINKWKDKLYEKYDLIKDIKKIYYFILVNAKKSFYICGCKVNVNNIKDIKSGELKEKSLFVENFIDNNYGRVKIYKSKKRMELRLYVKKWIETGKVIEIPYINKNKEVNMREEVKCGNREILKIRINEE